MTLWVSSLLIYWVATRNCGEKGSEDFDSRVGSTVLNYLKATDIEVGRLLHFGPQAGIKRRVCANFRK